MPLVKPAAPPGFLAQATQVQARGNWYAGNLVRWRTGLLEKTGGWRTLVEDRLTAIIRRFHAWLDLGNRKNLLIATDLGVNILVQDTIYGLGRQIDLLGGYIPVIGPVGATTKFSVALNSTTVTVKTASVPSVGGTFLLRLPISIGGRTILAGQFFTVKALDPAGGFTFDMPLPSLVAEADTYGVPLLENNIVNGFTVTWNAHGFVVGSQIRLTLTTTLKLGTKNATTKKYDKVDFDAPAGTMTVVDTVIDADHFTFKMETFGTGDGVAGTDHQIFVGSSIEHPTGQPIVSTIGVVIGLAIQTPLGDPQKQAWFLANLGEDGLALGSGGPLELYHPPIEDGPFLAPVGAVVGDTPAFCSQHNNGMLTAMPQGQVILWGSEGEVGEDTIDPLMIRWSDAGTFKNKEDWELSVSNQTGSFRLSRGSRIMGAIQAPQTTLILTDTDLWSMTYIGPPLIYGFVIIGSGCGLVAPHAIGNLGRMTMWQGQKNFWQFGDTAVAPVQCTVWDYIFTDIDPVNVNKCHAAPNSTTNELGFYFPSQHTMINVDKNLLLFSQDFNELSKWILANVLAQRFSLFKTLYVYEPQYVVSGWLEDSGLSPVAWWDHDLQSEVENLIKAPDGTDTTFLLQETDANGMHSISQKIFKAGERTTYTLSIYAHDSSTRNLTLRAVTNLGYAYATFNVQTGGLLAAGVTSPKFAMLSARVLIDVLGTGREDPDNENGWRRYVLTFTSDDSPTLELFFNITNGVEMNYQGVPPDGVLIWGAQLVLGPDPLDYQKTGGVARQNETRRYVKVNAAEGLAWDSGRLSRSAWLDESVWGTPLGADTTVIPPDPGVVTAVTAVLVQQQETASMRNNIMQHEIGFDDDVAPMMDVFGETGFTELGDGTMMMLIDEVHPDMKWFGRDGGVKMSLRAASWPQGPQHLYGPYSITPTTKWFEPRVRARYVAVRYDWEPRLGFGARVGVTTFHIKPAGRIP